MAVAVMENCSQRELDPLARQIDPDALNRLLENGSPVGVRISFQYSDCDVTGTPTEILIEQDGDDRLLQSSREDR